MYQIRELPVGDSGIQTPPEHKEAVDFPVHLIDYAVSTGHSRYRWQHGNLEIYRPHGDTAMRQTWYVNGLQFVKLSDLPAATVPPNTSPIPPFRVGIPTC
jgi:hypothetical protein